MEGKNKGYVAKVISNYQNMLDDNIINRGLMTSLYIEDCKMFLSILTKSKEINEDVSIKPNIINYVIQLSKKKSGKKFSGLLKSLNN